MPVVNHIVLTSGAVVAVSMALAAAIAIYESPEARRFSEDARRRVALALRSLENNFNQRQQNHQQHREPRFNRPEDANGFLMSRGGACEGADPGVDADEESRRRQREELLYWNSMRLKDEEAKQVPEAEKSKRSSSFDDFLKPDESEERGAFVFNSGADTHQEHNGLRRRGEGSRIANPSMYANPFADENFIDPQELDGTSSGQPMPTGDDAVMSDIYSATTRDAADELQAASIEQSAALIDFDEASPPTPLHTESAGTLERPPPDHGERDAPAHDGHQDAYASIQAWAQDSSRDFYSPLPVTPAAPVSEPELISDFDESDGQLTPTDSASLAGSGEDVGNEVLSSRDGENGRVYDVMSESEGMATPASWSEVGSVISESDAPVAQRA